jgi:hypothetical protein
MSFTRRVLSWALKRNKEGWLLVQSGNTYRFEPVDYDTDAGAYTIDGEDGEQYFEDVAGQMRQLDGVPVGLAADDSRLIVDAETAKTATAVDDKVEDRGVLSPEEELSVSEIMNSMKVGSVQTANGVSHLINPFHKAEDEPDIVDVRPVVRLFSNNTAPDTPRKSAENAVEAERAVKGLNVGKLGDWVQIVGSFLMGAITVEFIAGSSGGGGVDVPIMIMPDYALTLITTLL